MVAVPRALEREVSGGETLRRAGSSRLDEGRDDGEQSGGEDVGIHRPLSLVPARLGAP